MSRALVRFLWITALYVACAQVLFLFGHRSELRIEFWLPAGIVLGATLRYGLPYAWTALPGYLIVDYISLHWQQPAWVPLTVATLSALNAYATGKMMRAVMGTRASRLPEDGKDVLSFLTLSILPFAPLYSLVSLGCFAFAGAFTWPEALQMFFTWISGLITGTLVGAPVFLLFADKSLDWAHRARVLTAIASAVFLVGLLGHYADRYYLTDRAALRAEQASAITHEIERSLTSSGGAVRELDPALQSVQWVLRPSSESSSLDQPPLFSRELDSSRGAYTVDFYAFPAVKAYLGVEWRQRLLLALQLGLIAMASTLTLLGHGLYVKLEAKQRRLESVTSAILDSVTDAVLVSDTRGRIQSANSAATQLLGLSSPELVKHQLSDLVSEADRSLVLAALKRLAQQKQAQFLGLDEAMNLQAARGEQVPGEMVPCEMVLNTYCETQRDAAVVAVIRDIRERKLREEVTVAREVAEHANAAKSRFLDSLRHEMRTPLNAIIGYAELLIDEEDAGTWREKLVVYQKVQQSGRQLLRLLDGVLAISRLEAGTHPLNANGFDAEELSLDLESVGQKLASSAGCSFTLRSQLSGHLGSDVKRLRGALHPLLENAFKFNPGADIEVELNVLTEQDQDVLTVAVRDNGVGMAEIELAQIFDAFHQGAASDAASHEALGLGLAVARAYTESLGGSIQVSSRPGEGSVFTVSVPLQQ